MMFKQTPELQETDEEKAELLASSSVIGSAPISLESVNSLANDFQNQLNLNSEVSTATALIFSSSPNISTLSQPVKTFLKFVAEGEQDEAEALLQETPKLALLFGDVTDLSERTFKNITGFQYAVWALDWHMWTMIRKYLPDNDAREQIQNMATGSWIREHGASTSWKDLLSALQIFVDLCGRSKFGEAATQLQKQVGGAQRLLPVHVINEYCHPTRPFRPCPDFTSTSTLPRSRKIDKEACPHLIPPSTLHLSKVDEGEWFTTFYNGGKLGDKFAIWRSSSYACICGIGGGGLGQGGGIYVTWAAAHDLKACHALLNTRLQQRDQLFAELVSENRQAAHKTPQ